MTENRSRSLKANTSFRIFLSIIVVLLNSGYALTLGYVSEVLIITLAYLLVDCILYSSWRVSRSTVAFLIVFVCTVIVSMVVNLDFINFKEYIRIISVAVVGYRIFTVFSYKQLVTSFCKIMRVLVWVSLIFYLLANYIPQVPFPVVTNGYNTMYQTCFLSSLNTTIKMRNCGFFWEPGMFAAFSFLWTLLEIHFEDALSNKNFYAILSIVIILTTQSTTGIIYIFCIVVLMMTRNKERLSIPQFVFIVLLFTVAVFAFIFWDGLVLILAKINPVVFEKLLFQNQSYTDRLYGPLSDILMSLGHPFGIGIGDLTHRVMQLSMQVFGKAIHTRTSSITYYFVAFGWLNGIGVLVAIFSFAKQFLKSKMAIVRVINTLGLVLLCTSTPLNENMVFMILLFMGIERFAVQRINRSQTEIVE